MFIQSRHVIYLNDIFKVLAHFHYFVKSLCSLIYKFLGCYMWRFTVVSAADQTVGKFRILGADAP